MNALCMLSFICLAILNELIFYLAEEWHILQCMCVLFDVYDMYDCNKHVA